MHKRTHQLRQDIKLSSGRSRPRNVNGRAREGALLRLTIKMVLALLLANTIFGSVSMGTVYAISSSNPTLLVNTEAFQIIDAGDGSSNIEFRFGESGTNRLYYDATALQFVFTRPLFVQGNITGTGSLNMSGSILSNTNITLNSDRTAADATVTFGNATANQTLTFANTTQRFQFSTSAYINGSLSVTGTMSGRSLLVTGTGAKFSGSTATGMTLPLIATDLRKGAIVFGSGGLRHSGTGTMIPQVAIVGRVPTGLTGSVDAGAGTQRPYSVFVQGRYAYMANYFGDTLGIYDVSNPDSPRLVGSVDAGAGTQSPLSVFVQGRYAYMANYDGDTLGIYDVSNPSSPTLVGSVDAGAGTQSPISVFVQGRYAYMANYDGDTLGIYDVSNPSSPTLVGSVDAGAGTQNPQSVFVQGRYAYMANPFGDTLGIYDVSSPGSPRLVGSVDAGAGTQNPYSVFVQGRYAYMANYDGDTLGIYDVSNPSSPTLVGSVDAGAGTQSPISVFVQGRYAYMANYNGDTLGIYDVSSPGSPRLVGSVDAGAGTQNPYSVFVQGRYAYMANYNGDTLGIFDLGGAYIQQLEAGGAEVGTLSVRTNAQVFNDLDVKGGITAGRGFQAQAPSSIVNTSTGASAYALNVLSNTGALRLSVRNMGGNVRAPHIQFGTGTTFDTNLFRNAANSLRTMGGFNVGGTLSGAALTVSNLRSCDTIDTNAAGVLICGTDDGASAQAAVDARYVNISGDTMTGALRIANSAGLSASGSLLTESDVTLNSDRGASDAVLTFGNSTANQLLTFIHSRQIFQFSTDISVLGTASGRILHAQDQLRSSGTLLVTGNSTLNGTLSVKKTISGAALRLNTMTTSGAVVYSSGSSLRSTARGSSGNLLISQGAAAPIWKAAISSLTWYKDGVLTVTTSGSTVMTMPFGMTAVSVKLHSKGAPTGAAIIVDINKNGTSIFGTRPQIAIGSKTGGSSAVFTTTDLPENSVLTMDIDQVGSTLAGSGLTIMLNGTRKY